MSWKWNDHQTETKKAMTAGSHFQPETRIRIILWWLCLVNQQSALISAWLVSFFGPWGTFARTVTISSFRYWSGIGINMPCQAEPCCTVRWKDVNVHVLTLDIEVQSKSITCRILKIDLDFKLSSYILKTWYRLYFARILYAVLLSLCSDTLTYVYVIVLPNWAEIK